MSTENQIAGMRQPNQRKTTFDVKQEGATDVIRLVGLTMVAGAIAIPKIQDSNRGQSTVSEPRYGDINYFSLNGGGSKNYALIEAFQPASLIAQAIADPAAMLIIIRNRSTSGSRAVVSNKVDSLLDNSSAGKSPKTMPSFFTVEKLEAVCRGAELPAVFDIDAQEPSPGVTALKGPHGPLTTNEFIEYSFRRFGGDDSIWLVALSDISTGSYSNATMLQGGDELDNGAEESGPRRCVIHGHVAFRLAALVSYSPETINLIDKAGWIKEDNEIQLTGALIEDLRMMSRFMRQPAEEGIYNPVNSVEGVVRTSLGKAIARRLSEMSAATR